MISNQINKISKGVFIWYIKKIDFILKKSQVEEGCLDCMGERFC